MEMSLKEMLLACESINIPAIYDDNINMPSISCQKKGLFFGENWIMKKGHIFYYIGIGEEEKKTGAKR